MLLRVTCVRLVITAHVVFMADKTPGSWPARRRDG